MPDVRVVQSLAEVDRPQWNALFPGALEDYDYLLAVERAGLEGFRWRYVLVHDGAELVGAAAGFLTDYALDTTLTGAGGKVAQALKRVAPDALTLRLACLGSPCSEKALLSVSPDAPLAGRQALAAALIAGFETEAREARCGLLGLKDLAEADAPLWAAAAAPFGYRPVPSLPTAFLPIDFADLDAYFARLSPGVRKDMRRKLRSLERVRIEVREEIGDVTGRLMELYAQTRARAEMSFEDLTPAYFQGVLAAMPGRASMALYFEGDDLLAANLLLRDETTLLDKYFVMDAVRGRALNLYFLSWFTNIRLCLEGGQTRYQAGQAAYEVKLKLGSRLERVTNYFRHRNPLLNAALRVAAPLFAADPTLKAAA